MADGDTVPAGKLDLTVVVAAASPGGEYRRDGGRRSRAGQLAPAAAAAPYRQAGRINLGSPVDRHP
jgi:hypothetical protein